MASIYPPDFPFQPHSIEVGGYRLAYFDEGQAARTALMVHGNPVSAYVYYRLMRRLLPSLRCVAPDLPGFGLSDKPSQVTDYSLAKYVELLVGFVQALDLRNVVIIGHDWGGPIGFGAAICEPQRYSHLVSLNTLTEAPMKIMPHYSLPFYFFLHFGQLFDYLVRHHNLFQKLGLSRMDKVDQQVYFQANHNPETRAGIAAFPRMIPHNVAHPDYPLLREILGRIEQWEIPALVMFSDHDSVFTAAQGERFAQRLKQAHFKLITGPRHFLQYEAPGSIAQGIFEFLQIGDTPISNQSPVSTLGQFLDVEQGGG